MPDYTYLIVGGGMTADAAAQAIREADPAVRPTAALESALERRARGEDLAKDRRHRGRVAPRPPGRVDRSAGAPGDGRPGHEIPLRKAVARHGRDAATAAAQDGPDHLLPHARRLPPAAPAREPERALRRDRRRL